LPTAKRNVGCLAFFAFLSYAGVVQEHGGSCTLCCFANLLDCVYNACADASSSEISTYSVTISPKVFHRNLKRKLNGRKMTFGDGVLVVLKFGNTFI
jgi:hypothetical protein